MNFFWKRSKRKILTDSLVNDRKKMINDSTSFAVAEAYKAARTNLMFMEVKGKCRKVAFTSSMPNEGKSINCINMGITLAQIGNRVLLIDADMRKPTLHRMFYEQAAPGLSDKLAGLTNENCIRETSYNNLFLMTSGRIPPNPSELLASEKMKILLSEFSESFDCILVDTPPINVVTDVAIISKYVQGIIFVVREGVSKSDILKEAIVKLEQVSANIIGFILNDMQTQQGSYYKYRYKYSYGETPLDK